MLCAKLQINAIQSREQGQDKNRIFFHFPRTPKRRNQWLQSISRFGQRGEKDKFLLKNAIICKFNCTKSLKCNVVPKFKNMKKPIVERKRYVVKSKKKRSVAKKSLFEDIGEPSQDPINNKTQEVKKPFAMS